MAAAHNPNRDSHNKDNHSKAVKRKPIPIILLQNNKEASKTNKDVSKAANSNAPVQPVVKQVQMLKIPTSAKRKKKRKKTIPFQESRAHVRTTRALVKISNYFEL